MNTNGDLSQTWIGLIKVEQRERMGPLGDADRAYSNVIGLAKNKRQFREMVKNALEDLELYLLRMEAPEPLEQRLSNHVVHKRILKLAAGLSQENPMAFDVFATFDAGGMPDEQL